MPRRVSQRHSMTLNTGEFIALTHIWIFFLKSWYFEKNHKKSVGALRLAEFQWILPNITYWRTTVWLAALSWIKKCIKLTFWGRTFYKYQWWILQAMFSVIYFSRYVFWCFPSQRECKLIQEDLLLYHHKMEKVYSFPTWQSNSIWFLPLCDP